MQDFFKLVQVPRGPGAFYGPFLTPTNWHPIFAQKGYANDRHIFYPGGRVFDSEGIKIEGGREEEDERWNVYHSSL
jgi:hypothetical protein